MKTETLKQLIKNVLETYDVEDRTFVLGKISELIDLYEKDNEPNWFTYSQPHTGKSVIYADICSCNPKNGGSGICGCTMANKIVEPTHWKTTIATTNTNVQTETPRNS